jgi:hypothetical protein
MPIDENVPYSSKLNIPWPWTCPKTCNVHKTPNNKIVSNPSLPKRANAALKMFHTYCFLAKNVPFLANKSVGFVKMVHIFSGE